MRGRGGSTVSLLLLLMSLHSLYLVLIDGGVNRIRSKWFRFGNRDTSSRIELYVGSVIPEREITGVIFITGGSKSFRDPIKTESYRCFSYYILRIHIVCHCTHHELVYRPNQLQQHTVTHSLLSSKLSLSSSLFILLVLVVINTTKATPITNSARKNTPTSTPKTGTRMELLP